MDNNPFSLSFGKTPACVIERPMQEKEIIDDYLLDAPSSQIYVITGVRGSGKTVSMTRISEVFRSRQGWTVIDAMSEEDVIEQINASLCAAKPLRKIFSEFRLSIKLPGIEMSFGNEETITDAAVALDSMLDCMSKRHQRLLVVIDEVVPNKYMRKFTSFFQILIRKNYPIFLLMTGLFENIYELQNEKTLTFLYRAPKIPLSPLNQRQIIQKYEQHLGVSADEAVDMASLTKGYPFAFQLLGYLCYKNDKPWQQVLDDFDMYLEEYVYEKIWQEMSQNDQKVAIAMAKCEDTKVEAIREIVGMVSGVFGTYRKRLIRKGIVFSPSYGHLEFSLPRFAEFVLANA